MTTTGETERRLTLRRPDACRCCGLELAAGEKAVYERERRTVRCLDCSADQPNDPEPSVLESPVVADPTPHLADADTGEAGASARREYEKRKMQREKRIRDTHPRIGGLILTLSDEPQSTRAWATGAAGEEELGRRLDAATGISTRVLHDRRIPGTRANIDHVVVCPGGVFVVDAKRYTGRPALRTEGGLFRPRVERLVVAGRDRTSLVDGALRQRDLVRGVVGDAVPVTAVLCFVRADWPLIGGDFEIRGVRVVWQKKLVAMLEAAGSLGPAEVDALARSIADAFPRA